MQRRTLFPLAGLSLIGPLGSLITSKAKAVVCMPDSGSLNLQLPPRCQILIIGSGAAGLTAAIMAAEAGIKDIVVLEKEPIVGGSSMISGGQWAVSETELQRRNGILDTDSIFYADMLRIGKNRNDPQLVKKLIQVSREQYNWVLEHGVAPLALSAASGMSRPRAHTFDAVAVMNLLLRMAARHNIPIITGARATELLMSNGTMHGAAVEYAGSHQRVQANAVLLASYGFVRTPTRISDMTLIYYAGGIILNQAGKRFVDESLSYKELGTASLTEPGYSTYILFDDAMRREQMRQRPNDWRLWHLIDQGRVPDYVYKADSIEDAAAAAGLNPAVVTSTVEEYNRLAPHGKDPLGRTSLSSGWGTPQEIKSPPFFIMPAVAAVMGTYCGLTITPDAEVLNQKKQIIPGLYAAGEVTGGFHGASYITGTAFAKAHAFGRIAGMAMARRLL